MMKIYSDSLQDKIDEYEKSKIGYKEKIRVLQEVLKAIILNLTLLIVSK